MHISINLTVLKLKAKKIIVKKLEFFIQKIGNPYFYKFFLLKCLLQIIFLDSMLYMKGEVTSSILFLKRSFNYTFFIYQSFIYYWFLERWQSHQFTLLLFLEILVMEWGHKPYFLQIWLFIYDNFDYKNNDEPLIYAILIHRQ